MASRWMSSDNLRDEALSFVLKHKAHAQHIVTCTTDVHGEQVTGGLRVEACNVEFSQNGIDVTESACGGALTKDHGTGLAVSLDVKETTKATECGFDFFQAIHEEWGLCMMLPISESWRVGAQG